MNTASKQQFLGGAMALTISTALVKIIGLVYKIPLMRCLGAEGMGYFNSAYELYTLFFVIATAGIPVAISIMISESLASGRIKNAEKIYKVSLWLLMAVGCVSAFIMCFGASFLAGVIDSPGSALSLVFVAPTLFFISISGVVRGYFQGCRNMLPTAVSQVVESLGKLILGIGFAYIAQRRGLPVQKVSAFAILGLTVGTMISTLYLCIARSKSRLTYEVKILENSCDGSGNMIKKLAVLAVPVTASSVLVSLTRIVDMFMLMNRLGDDIDKISLYGSYSTMALPIYNLPSSLVAGIALALVPSITNAVKLNQKEREKQLVASGIKLCAVISLPAALGIGVYSKQILGLLFYGENEAIAISAPLLSMLGVSVFASCLVQITNSVLQANGKILHPIISMLCGLGAKGVFAYYLISIPSIGAMGAPISTLLCNLIAVVINLWFIGRHTSFDISLGEILTKPVVCSTSSLAASIFGYVGAIGYGARDSVAFVIAMALCVLLYFVFVFFGDILDSEEYAMLPFGNKIFRMRKKIKINKDNNYEQGRKNQGTFKKGKLSF